MARIPLDAASARRVIQELYRVAFLLEHETATIQTAFTTIPHGTIAFLPVQL
jgi:hypothetical protein